MLDAYSGQGVSPPYLWMAHFRASKITQSLPELRVWVGEIGPETGFGEIMPCFPKAASEGASATRAFLGRLTVAPSRFAGKSIPSRITQRLGDCLHFDAVFRPALNESDTVPGTSARS
jgi:hypothetical protein